MFSDRLGAQDIKHTKPDCWPVPGDVLLEVHGKSVHKMRVQDVLQELGSGRGLVKVGRLSSRGALLDVRDPVALVLASLCSLTAARDEHGGTEAAATVLRTGALVALAQSVLRQLLFAAACARTGKGRFDASEAAVAGHPLAAVWQLVAKIVEPGQGGEIGLTVADTQCVARDLGSYLRRAAMLLVAFECANGLEAERSAWRRAVCDAAQAAEPDAQFLWRLLGLPPLDHVAASLETQDLLGTWIKAWASCNASVVQSIWPAGASAQDVRAGPLVWVRTQLELRARRLRSVDGASSSLVSVIPPRMLARGVRGLVRGGAQVPLPLDGLDHHGACVVPSVRRGAVRGLGVLPAQARGRHARATPRRAARAWACSSFCNAARSCSAVPCTACGSLRRTWTPTASPTPSCVAGTVCSCSTTCCTS